MGKAVVVFIPVYNEEKFLSETISSVLNQTFEDFDLIISDNHSTDSTARIIQEFQARDKRVIVWQPEHFCKSVEHGRYFINRLNQMDYDSTVMLGGHDLIDYRYVEVLYSSYQANPTASMIVGSGFEIDTTGNRLREWPSIPQLRGGVIFMRPLILLMALFYNIAAFGLFPSAIRKTLKVRHNCVGNDHLYIAEASLLGDIIVEPDAVIYTRRTEGAGDHETYFKKHISENIQVDSVVENLNKQLEWVSHINDLAFANFPETIKNINLASSLGAYFTRYGVAQLSHVEGAMEMWLNSDFGKIIATNLNTVGSMYCDKIRTAPGVV